MRSESPAGPGLHKPLGKGEQVISKADSSRDSTNILPFPKHLITCRGCGTRTLWQHRGLCHDCFSWSGESCMLTTWQALVDAAQAERRGVIQ